MFLHNKDPFVLKKLTLKVVGLLKHVVDCIVYWYKCIIAVLCETWWKYSSTSLAQSMYNIKTNYIHMEGWQWW